MRQQQYTTNPEHPDLQKYLDEPLARELDYTRTQYARTAAAIEAHIKAAAIEPGQMPDLPLWMLQSDLNFHLDRFDAIIEEMRYRKEMMQ